MTKIVYLIDDITPESYKRFSRTLDNAANDDTIDNIEVELMSLGGDAMSAIAFASKIENYDARTITVTATGSVESAAVMILAAGHKSRMHSSAWVMVHEDSGKIKGNIMTMERTIAHCRRLETQWCKLLEHYTGTSYEIWDKLHKDETNLSAEECLALKLVDEVI